MPRGAKDSKVPVCFLVYTLCHAHGGRALFCSPPAGENLARTQTLEVAQLAKKQKQGIHLCSARLHSSNTAALMGSEQPAPVLPVSATFTSSAAQK